MSALPDSLPVASPNGGFTTDVFAAHLATQSDLPAWWLEAKKAAWNQFLALPLPKRTDELWRFSNLAGVKLDGFTLPAAVHPGIIRAPASGSPPRLNSSSPTIPSCTGCRLRPRWLRVA